MGDHSKKKKGKKDKRKDDKDRNNDNANQRLKQETPVDTFYPVCHDISLNTDRVNVNTISSVSQQPSGATQTAWLRFDDINGTGPAVPQVFNAQSYDALPITESSARPKSPYYTILTGTNNWIWNASIPAAVQTRDGGSAGRSIGINHSGFGMLVYYSSIPFDFDFVSNSLSISLFIYTTDAVTTGNPKIIFGRITNTNNWFILQKQTSSQKIWFEVCIAGVLYRRESTIALSANAWHHVAVTWNGSNAVTLYLDGTAGVASTITPTNPGGATFFDKMFIGSPAGYGSSIDFKGYVDDFQFWWGKIFNQTEVNNLVNHALIT